MGNIKIEKTDSDLDFDVVYFSIEVRNQGYPTTGDLGFVGSVLMYGYMGRVEFQEVGTRVIEFSLNPTEGYCFQLSETLLGADGNLLIEFLPTIHTGCVEIKICSEIKINTNRTERCEFYIKSELGLIEQFGKRLKSFAEQGGLQEVNLHTMNNE
ncbi:MAG: hypothetical protein FWG67_01650 [Defluviitaleaceae bacterium]|nr:hypothetical protein [Defluviitaleaceae bacterium]